MTKPKSAFFEKAPAVIAVVVILAVFTCSAVMIATRVVDEESPDTITLHIAHWQLEHGVRTGIDALGKEYEKVWAERWAAGAKSVEGQEWRKLYPDKPRVRIIQDAVPESFYGPWVSTQLMGGCAPDIMEVGLGGQGLPRARWISFLNRYFVPVTSIVARPNPHNTEKDLFEGKSIKDWPLAKTYLDGMRGGYVEELHDFLLFPVSQFVVRVFYNKDLLRSLTEQMVKDGKLKAAMDAPPTEYRAFLDLCHKIKQYNGADGSPYTAIANSGNYNWMWEISTTDVTTPSLVRMIDTNYDGLVDGPEVYAAIKSGRVDMMMPAYRAQFQVTRDILPCFQEGFIGLARDDALFLFAQQRCVFISSGTWDAGSLRTQAEGVFKVGVCEFPLPASDDPEYGPFIEGRHYDSPSTAAAFGVTRSSKYADVAIDFLEFITSQKGNQQLNDEFRWVPAIKGAASPTDLEGFEPHFDGVQIVSPEMHVIGGESWQAWYPQMDKFRVARPADYTVDQAVADIQGRLRDKSDNDWIDQMKDRRRGMVSADVILTGMRYHAIEAEAAAAAGDKGAANQAASEWIKYRTLTATRQLFNEYLTSRQGALVRHEPSLLPTDYTPEAIENIRKHAADPPAPAPAKSPAVPPAPPAPAPAKSAKSATVEPAP